MLNSCLVFPSIFRHNLPIKTLLIVLISSCLIACNSNHNGKTDFKQAELMLEFLRTLSKGELNSDTVDALIKTKGMDLIIEQQNRRATINKTQYRNLLLGMLNEKVPDIEPVDSSERAKLGVHRLKNNVWPSLKWAVGNVDLLAERLTFLNGLNVGSQAKAIADSFLPEPLQSIPDIFFVMGGRAGFYAGDNCIYMDILSMSYSPKGVKPLVESDIIDFFAHEMHHVGYHDLSRNKFSQLRLNEKQSRAYGFVSGLVAEGSATYLVNGHRDIDFIRNNRRYAGYFNLDDDLREICEDILQSILNGHIENDDDYSKATEPLLGMGYHAAGSMIMHVIYHAGGLEPVMRVLQDPRLLLIEYNGAAEKLMTESKSDSIYLFDEELVDIISHMGQ